MKNHKMFLAFLAFLPLTLGNAVAQQLPQALFGDGLFSEAPSDHGHH